MKAERSDWQKSINPWLRPEHMNLVSFKGKCITIALRLLGNAQQQDEIHFIQQIVQYADNKTQLGPPVKD